jgi:holo-[acyl-carrier protein] synthase
VGIDLIEIDRIRAVRARFGARFLDRVFTQGEQLYCARRSEEAASLAVRWAAKEAFAKAARLTPAPLWTEVEVVVDVGRPSLLLSPRLAERIGPHKLLVSLTHGRNDAIAVVVLLDLLPLASA